MYLGVYMYKKAFVLLFLLFSICDLLPQAQNNLLDSLLRANRESFPDVLNDQAKFKIQIFLTVIDREDKSGIDFKTYKYNFDKEDYFYPASTVKFPAALLALEKFNLLRDKGISKDTKYFIDSELYSEKDSIGNDVRRYFTIAEDVKRIFLVSDNNAFNHLYDFLGQKGLNENLWIKRYSGVKLIHRLSFGLSNEDNRRTGDFVFVNNNNEEVYRKSSETNPIQLRNCINNLKQGIGYYSNDKLINEPMDFTFKNYFSLEDQHYMLKALIFPEYVPEEMRFNLSKEDREMVLDYMSMYPWQSGFEEYQNKEKYPNNYVKYFYHKDMESESLKIFNKVGQAYGYLIDNAYITDADKGIEFLLSAIIYVNSDGIFNDDIYEYKEIGYPFMENLGRVIYNYCRELE